MRPQPAISPASPPPSATPPSRRAASDGLATRLRQDILYCRWVAGQWLKQAELEAHYGVGRSEVRKALAEMLRLGLVVHELNRGYRVTPPDPGRRAEIRATRMALEAAAVDGILAHATPDDVARLRGLAEQFAAAAEEGSFARLVTLNQDFHAALYALCGNSFLAELIGELRTRGLAGSTGRWTTAPGLRATAREHLAMVEAIAAGDAEGLRGLIRAHIAAF